MIKFEKEMEDIRTRLKELEERGIKYNREIISFFPADYGLLFRLLPADCHYRHKSINLALAVSSVASNGLDRLAFGEPEELAQQRLQDAEQTLLDLETYFELLQKFPEYREAEFMTAEGFFSDCEKLRTAALGHQGDYYVIASKMLLEK
ncbi:MAG: hypothetical protein Q8R53_01295 [Nanoarchaeota archaeon]|nr:hypothetical protein [Nanoarchaeota archaeon]